MSHNSFGYVWGDFVAVDLRFTFGWKISRGCRGVLSAGAEHLHYRANIASALILDEGRIMIMVPNYPPCPLQQKSDQRPGATNILVCFCGRVHRLLHSSTGPVY